MQKVKINRITKHNQKHIYLSIPVDHIENNDVVISKDKQVVITDNYNVRYTPDYINDNISNFEKVIACTDRYFYNYSVPKLSNENVEQIIASKKRTAYIELESKQKLFIDPNDGWRYGFPKYSDEFEMNGEQINEFLEKKGYPMKNLHYYRTWIKEVNEIKNFKL